MVAARLFKVDGTVSREIFMLSPEGPNRKGQVLLVRRNRSIRVHPRRVLPVKNGGVLVYLVKGRLCAKCPKCKRPVNVVIGGVQAECSDHGAFQLDWHKLKPGVLPMIEPSKNAKADDHKQPAPGAQSAGKVKPQRESATIDFAALKAQGELWTKDSIKFDYPNFTVKSHALLITTKPMRKFCFNSYNGTWGRKSKRKMLEAFVANTKLDGKQVGFALKGDLDKERKRLLKAGYQQES